MALHPELIDILICPDDHGSLWYVESEEVLFNPRTNRRYRVRDGVPDMLVEESEIVEQPEADRLQQRIDAGEAVLTHQR